MATLNDVENRINAVLYEDPTGPTAGSSDWNLYLQFINMSQDEWAQTYHWSQLYKEINTNTSQATGNVTISLPSDFDRFDGAPRIDLNTYPQVEPEKRFQYSDTENYCYILGYPGNYSLIQHGLDVGSGASIYYSYWSTPVSLASPTDVVQCPDTNFLVYRSLAYFWETRDDGRSVEAKNESDRILARLLENEVAKGHSFNDRIQTSEEIQGFQIGRD